MPLADIQTTINAGKPFGVLYSDMNSGHWIVAIGYAVAKNHNPIIISNDPAHGVQRQQTLNEFQKYEEGRTWTWTAR